MMRYIRILVFLVFLHLFFFQYSFAEILPSQKFNFSNFFYTYNKSLLPLNNILKSVCFGDFCNVIRSNIPVRTPPQVSVPVAETELIIEEEPNNENSAITDLADPTFYSKPTDFGYASPTQAQIDFRLAQTGKDYIPPSSSSFTPASTYQQASYGTPNAASQFYQNNPDLIGKPTGNPAVWDGNPATRPPDLGNDNQVRVDMNSPNFSGKPDANPDSLRSIQDGRFSEISPDGWLSTGATNFGLNINGSADTGLVGYSQGCPTAMGGFSAQGSVRVCNKAACVVSLPPDVLDYYYGKTKWPTSKWAAPGPVPYTYGNPGQLYRKIAGTAIEIVNKDNGKCTVAPVWDIGPSKSECQRGKCGLDLTYCVKVTLLDSKKGITPVRYRPVPEGKRGCEGYTYVPAPVNGLPAKK